MSQNWLTYFKPQNNLTDYIRLTIAGKREMISVNCLFVCRQSSAVSVPVSAPDFWACNAFLTTSDTILQTHKKHFIQYVNGWLSQLQMLLLHIIISKYVYPTMLFIQIIVDKDSTLIYQGNKVVSVFRPATKLPPNLRYFVTSCQV